MKATVSSRLRTTVRAFLSLALLATVATALLVASDHGDVPAGLTGPRQDANLTDLYAFTSGSNLVLVLCSNPAIPPGATGYVFPTDVTFEINIDNRSAVSGGVVEKPDQINPDVTFRVRFHSDGSAKIQRMGKGGNGAADAGLVSFFAGLRDDPFIRGPRTGRNIAAIVMEVPLSSVLDGQSTLLVWATSNVNDFDGPFQDLAGRSLLSMFPENAMMNTMDPRHMQRRMGKAPDVLIYNTALAAAFPNGRALTDDVVDLVGDNRVLANDAPFPAANDVPFLSSFPYLAPPQ